MKRLILKHIIFTAIIILLSSQTAFSQESEKYSEYTGFYTYIKNEHIKIIVLEKNRTLYGQSLNGIYPITLLSKTDYKFTAYNTGVGDVTSQGRFSEFENGKYQKINLTQGRDEFTFKRQYIPESLYKSAFYEQIGKVENIVGLCNAKPLPGESFDIETGTLEEAGGDRSLIKKLTGLAAGMVNSLLVVKGGRLVVEEYFNGYSAEDSQYAACVYKSIVSLMLGEAIEKRYIKSINDRIYKYLPEYRSILTGQKKKITIKHLAENSLGLDWDAWAVPYSDPQNIAVRWVKSPDPLKFVLERPLIHKPGKVFAYNSGGVGVLWEILKNASGSKSFEGYAKQSSLSHLKFKNAYITPLHWYLRPRDMVKVGQLVLNNGIWNGKQLVSKKWIQESTKRHIDTGASWDGYGYLWWHKTFKVGNREFKAIAAYGGGGQKIVIVRELDLVIVTTGNRGDNPVLIVTGLVIEAFI